MQSLTFSHFIQTQKPSSLSSNYNREVALEKKKNTKIQEKMINSKD